MRSLYILAMAGLLSACVTPQIPLAEQKANYPTLDVALLEMDEPIIISLGTAPATSGGAYVPMMLPPGTSVGQAAAAGAAGGLFAALIIAGINSAERADAAKDIAPVQAALGETRFGPQIRAAMGEAVQELDWTDINELRIVDLDDKEALKSAILDADTSGVLTIATSNFLSRNAGALVFSVRAAIFPTTVEETKQSRRRLPAATYSTTVSFEVNSPVVGKRRADFLPTWALNDAELIRAAAAQAEPLLVEMMVRQLTDGNVPMNKVDGGAVVKRVTSSFGSGVSTKVEILETRQYGELVRDSGGSLRFLASEITPLAENVPEVEDPISDIPALEPLAEEEAALLPASINGEELDLLKEFRMAPIGNDAGLPGLYDKILKISD